MDNLFSTLGWSVYTLWTPIKFYERGQRQESFQYEDYCVLTDVSIPKDTIIMGLLLLTLEDTLEDIRGRVTRRCLGALQSICFPRGINVAFFERFKLFLILKTIAKLRPQLNVKLCDEKIKSTKTFFTF